MHFIIDKESLLNKLKIVEKITTIRNIQPVLSNILFEAEGNTLKLSTTDLEISIITKTVAKIHEEGKITIPAKKIYEIVSKLYDKPIEFCLNPDNNIVTIKCGNSKFDVVGISAEEFPKILQEEEEIKDDEAIIIDSNPFLKAIKYTVYAVANYDNRTVISGVYCQINKDNIEMASTDGNRLTRISEKIQNENGKEAKLVIPGKTVSEILRVSSIINEDKFYIKALNSKIIIKTNSYMIISKLNSGVYPQYQQLIPKTTSKMIKVNKNDLINAIDRVSCLAEEKTKIIKLVFQEGKLYLKAESRETGTSEDNIETDYQGEEFKIAFNYKLINDFLKIIDSEDVIIGLNGSQSATVLRPDNNDDYLCLVMPMKVQ